uniref:Uncharacterized protein n=1 Tax=Arundo donax TaxID=35708 RepID=A0A0A9BGU0_ARUDO
MSYFDLKIWILARFSWLQFEKNLFDLIQFSCLLFIQSNMLC